MIKLAYSVSFLLSINISVWQNVLYFPYELRTIRVLHLFCIYKCATFNIILDVTFVFTFTLVLSAVCMCVMSSTAVFIFLYFSDFMLS